MKVTGFRFLDSSGGDEYELNKCINELMFLSEIRTCNEKIGTCCLLSV